MWLRTPGAKRWAGWLAIYVIVVVGSVVAWLAQSAPATITEQTGASRISIATEHSHLLPLVRPCTTVTWEMEGIRKVFINNQGTVGSGQVTTCVGEESPRFQVTFADSTEAFYQHDLYIFRLSLLGLLLISAFLVSLAHVVVNIPLPTLPELLPVRLRLGVLVILANVVGLLAFGARTAVALREPNALNWDERYYASIAATVANGYGLYPHILGYEQMPVMGGIGQLARLYALAYQALGPTITNLRVVIVVASLLGVWAVYATLAHLYGRGTGLVGVALLPSFLLFAFTNSIRMDAITFAFVGWALHFFVRKQDAEQPHWHLLIGFVFGLGLQAHLHTFAVSFAVGFTYLGRYLWGLARRTPQRSFWRQPVLLFIGGYAVAFVLFVVMNILPNPEAFFRTAGLARVSAADNTTIDLTRELNVGTLVGSFINPARLFDKEWTRYQSLIFGTYTQYATEFPPMTETQGLLLLAGAATLFVRQGAADRLLRWVLVGSVIGGAIIFNSVGVGYLSHIGPVLFIGVAPLFTHGFRHTERVDLRQITTSTLILLVFVWSYFAPIDNLTTMRYYISQNPAAELQPSPLDITVLENVDTGCHIAADSGRFIPHLMPYPRFTSTGADILIGMTYYDLGPGEERAYLTIKDPDVILGPFFGEIQGFAEENGYAEQWPGVWVKPGSLSDGCSIASS